RRRRGEVASDGREIERRDRVDESLEGAVIHPVPRTRCRIRLLLVNPLGVVDVEPEEVDELAGAVDLRLEGRLALSQHGGRVEALAMAGGQKVGGPEEYRGAVLESPVAPVTLCVHRGGNGGIDRGLVGLVKRGEHPRVAMG